MQFEFDVESLLNPNSEGIAILDGTLNQRKSKQHYSAGMIVDPIQAKVNQIIDEIGILSSNVSFAFMFFRVKAFLL